MAVVPFVQASVAFLLVADRLLSRHGSPCPLLLSPSFIEQTYNAVSTCSSCNAATGDSEGVGADCPVCGEGWWRVSGLAPAVSHTERLEPRCLACANARFPNVPKGHPPDMGIRQAPTRGQLRKNSYRLTCCFVSRRVQVLSNYKNGVSRTNDASRPPWARGCNDSRK